MVSATGKQCLNCGAELRGRFCSACGQRDVPPAPTLRELIDEAWQELTIFDSRLWATLRLLLPRPGGLTLETMAGRRERYIKPLRLYLIASLAYFLLGAVFPASPLARTTASLPGGRDIQVDLMNPQALPPAQLEEALRRIERAPPPLQPMLRRMFLDPVGLRRNMIETLPRVLFVLVPVFATIVALFYRRPFSQHLVFALHLHAAAFIVLSISRIGHFGTSAIAATFAVASLGFLLVYGLLACRRVYRESWSRTLIKAFVILFIYMLTGLMALTFAVAWASVR